MYDKRTKRDELGRAHFYIAWGKGDIAAESLAKITLDINFFYSSTPVPSNYYLQGHCSINLIRASDRANVQGQTTKWEKIFANCINPGFLHCRWMLYCPSHQGRPNISDKRLIYKIYKEVIQLY